MLIGDYIPNYAEKAFWNPLIAHRKAPLRLSGVGPPLVFQK
jgi:hypothetical protein